MIAVQAPSKWHTLASPEEIQNLKDQEGLLCIEVTFPLTHDSCVLLQEYKDRIVGLNLTHAILTDETLKDIAEFKDLNFLDLSRSHRITDTGISYLKDLRLQILNMSFCSKITDRAIEDISAMDNLEILDLSECKGITDKCVQSLSRLIHLTVLKLAACRMISDRTIAHLPQKELKIVDLSNCPSVTHKGLKHLLENNQLKALSLTCCRNITDEGFEGIENQKELEILELRFLKKITDNAIEKIVKIGSLKKVDLFSCTKLSLRSAELLQHRNFTVNLGGCNKELLSAITPQ
jgi:hypothetical protein